MKVPTLPASLVNNKSSDLTPQILNEISIKDAVTLNAANQALYDRTATIECFLMYLPLSDLDNSLDKLFLQIQDSISLDLNPITVADVPRAIDPTMQFSVQVDKTKSPAITVSVYIKIENLKPAFINSSLSRLKIYISNAIT